MVRIEMMAKYGFIKKETVKIILGDGAKGYPVAAPFHKIITAAAAKAIPVAWKQQVRVGGRIVAPVKNCIQVLDKIYNNEFNLTEYSGFSFVPLVTNEGGSGQ